jgi:hypothetical protein
MGYMADMALDETMTEEDLRLEYRLGGMTDQQAYDIGLIDERGAEYRPFKKSAKTCRHCLASGLSWLMTDAGWRLSSNGQIHNCPKFKRDQS